jgi:hypothetical protein
MVFKYRHHLKPLLCAAFGNDRVARANKRVVMGTAAPKKFFYCSGQNDELRRAGQYQVVIPTTSQSTLDLNVDVTAQVASMSTTAPIMDLY